ncbi:hypothetical protein Poly51_11560 [Rubripirellula tenax]|uniref:Uncharacterized protein n=1 Tax=Rubripirellula tenax TaxID=2528015 RepID=A0A5C6FM18_9BACT|nr:hypothetical protein Poly51_11560 [Rubripirellula tenax]
MQNCNWVTKCFGRSVCRNTRFVENDVTWQYHGSTVHMISLSANGQRQHYGELKTLNVFMLRNAGT